MLTARNKVLWCVMAVLSTAPLCAAEHAHEHAHPEDAAIHPHVHDGHHEHDKVHTLLDDMTAKFAESTKPTWDQALQTKLQAHAWLPQGIDGGQRVLIEGIQVIIKGACNVHFGQIAGLETGAFKFTAGGSTDKLCPNDQAKAAEEALLGRLGQAQSFVLDATGLTLFDGGKKSVLALIKPQ